MSDIYQAPTAQLNQSGQNGEYGSLAKGISGDYVFSIGDTLSEAWAKTSGKKLTFFLAFLTLTYLSVAYFLALPLIVEKNLGRREAMEASRKAIRKRWFSVFLMMLIFFVLMMLSFLTLTIGLIWAMPLMMLSIGILYSNMFGVADAGV